MALHLNNKFPVYVLLMSLILVLPGCATNWPNPYEKPEPVIVTAPDEVPQVEPEPESPVFETIPLPSESVNVPPPANVPAPPPVIEAEPELAAVVSLRGQAAESMSAGEPDQAAATIERALRIQPRNPVLWLDLAAVRFAQEEFAQCENTAKRALSYAGNKNDVSYDAWILIANSRLARNDKEGAEKAESQASKYR